MMHGQTRVEFIFAVIIFVAIILYIVNQMNVVFSDVINGYEIDTKKAQALDVIKTLVETGDIEKNYVTEIPLDVVLVNDVSGSMDMGTGDTAIWGEGCYRNCYSFGAGTCKNTTMGGKCTSTQCQNHRCGDCDGNGFNSDPGEIGCSINDARDAANTFVNLLNTSGQLDKVGIVIFNRTAYHYLNMTFDKAAVLAAINSLNGIDNTQTAYGISNATDELTSVRARSDAKKVEIFLTDGHDEPCCTDIYGAATNASENNITIYSIGVGANISYINTTVLSDIAAMTGGKYYYVPDSKQLSSTYEQIAYEIKSQTTRFGLISHQPYNATIEKIYNLGNNCNNLNIFDLGTYRLKIYNSTNLLMTCGTDTLEPPKVFVSKYIVIGNDKGNITLELW